MKKTFTIALLLLFGSLLIACNNTTTTFFENPNTSYCTTSQKAGVYLCERRLTSYFDTIISLKIYVDSSFDEDLDTIFAEFQNLAMTYHRYFDKYNPYGGINNVYTINHTNGPVVVDVLLYEAIKYAKEHEDIVTDGENLLFNLALQPVLRIWNEARNHEDCIYDLMSGTDYCPVPNQSLLDRTFNIDSNDIIFDDDNLSIDFAKENMGIDLGGFGKGYISEVIIEYLSQYDLNYILNLGNSNVYANGSNPLNDEGVYNIALTTPFAEAGDPFYYAIVQLTDGLNLVSSGNYQRYFKNVNDYSDQTLYHHIIDPRTNYPGGSSISLTILCDNGAIGDILSTAIYLLSVEEGLEYVNSIEGLEALWYLGKDNVVMSDNFADYLMEPIN